MLLLLAAPDVAFQRHPTTWARERTASERGSTRFGAGCVRTVLNPPMRRPPSCRGGLRRVWYRSIRGRRGKKELVSL